MQQGSKKKHKQANNGFDRSTKMHEGVTDMKAEGKTTKIETKKILAINALMIASLAIMLIGIALIVYSFLYGMSFPVLSSNVHGSIFGLVIVFLGVRYLMGVIKLKSEVYKSTAHFSWSNFKRAKA